MLVRQLIARASSAACTIVSTSMYSQSTPMPSSTLLERRQSLRQSAPHMMIVLLMPR
jgi:hypothetical protein